MASDISTAFVEGIYEIYGAFYSSDITYYPFDVNTLHSIYGESESKLYLEPVVLVGSTSVITVEPARVEKVESYDVVFDIPAKSFLSAGILTEDLSYLSKGLFLYKEKYYKVGSIQLGSIIQDVTLNYLFNCYISDKNGS